jgi:hypothetical protein
MDRACRRPWVLPSLGHVRVSLDPPPNLDSLAQSQLDLANLTLGLAVGAPLKSGKHILVGRTSNINAVQTPDFRNFSIHYHNIINIASFYITSASS